MAVLLGCIADDFTGGTDLAGKSNALCLALVERRTGGLQVVTNIQPAKIFWVSCSGLVSAGSAG